MKSSLATLILAAATLAAPAAVGQSQALPVKSLPSAEALGAARAELQQVAASASFLPSNRTLRDFERSGATEPAGPRPSPEVSWLLALGFLAFIAVRRLRGSMF